MSQTMGDRSDREKLRELLARHLDWEDAHVAYRRAVANFPAELRGIVPDGFARSGWEIIEHLRLAQYDILDFCTNAEYEWPMSMEQYWPASHEPDHESSWDASIEGFQEDLDSLRALALDPDIDLFDLVPTGDTDQTLARELLLAADHTAYHLGQLIALRRALGCWE
ncbi:MAG: DinB family protein [Coriobacteriia bacterium]